MKRLIYSLPMIAAMLAMLVVAGCHSDSCC
jgi:hypothetical protein